jgi:hypothetical protein
MREISKKLLAQEEEQRRFARMKEANNNTKKPELSRKDTIGNRLRELVFPSALKNNNTEKK